jgi:hypothetical protein
VPRHGLLFGTLAYLILNRARHIQHLVAELKFILLLFTLLTKLASISRKGTSEGVTNITLSEQDILYASYYLTFNL